MPFGLAPFDFWIVTLAAPAVLFWRLVWSTPKAAVALGWWFGLGKYLLGASWVYVSIHEYGGASPVLAAALVGLFCAALAFFPALQAYVFVRYLARGALVRDAVAFAASYVALEWLLTWVLTGFPWLFLGYGHLDTWLGNFAPVGGVLAVSLMTALSGCLVAAALMTRRRAELLAAVVIATLPWVAGWALGRQEWVKPATRATVALVQGNIAQSAKWEPESVAPILATYRDLSDAAWGHDIVVWPEAAVTLFVEQARGYLDAMSARAARAGSALMLGIPDVERMPDGAPLFLNTALALGLGDGQYAKRRLVPFGEYVPFERLLRGLIAFFDLPMSHAVAGAEHQPPLELKSYRAAVAICYEIVYPELVRESAKTADVLITISNDTWFGRSLGPLQHMEMAQMRALENGRWLLRATNDGVTAIVDARGHIVKSLPRFEPGVLTGEFSVMTGQTPFTRFGTLPVLVVLAAMSFVGRTRRGA